MIVLPPAGTRAAGAAARRQKVADEIITQMKQKQLRSCVIEVRSLGSRRILVARGVARAPATGTGRLVIRVRIKPKGTKLLTKNFGGVIVNVRALCRSTSGVAHVGVKGVRAVLLDRARAHSARLVGARPADPDRHRPALRATPAHHM